MTTLGIDGAPSIAGIPDFAALPEYAFAIARICFGHVRDKGAPEYIRRAREAGKLTMGYPYLRSWENGASQADFALDLAAELEVFPWLDIEPAKKQRPDGSWPIATDAPHVAREVAIAWVARARERGARFGIYGGPYYLSALQLPEDFGDLPLWVSHYGVSAPRVPKPWRTYTIWQRIADKALAGANVDINESPFTVEQLAALGGPEVTPRPCEPRGPA